MQISHIPSLSLCLPSLSLRKLYLGCLGFHVFGNLFLWWNTISFVSQRSGCEPNGSMVKRFIFFHGVRIGNLSNICRNTKRGHWRSQVACRAFKCGRNPTIVNLPASRGSESRRHFCRIADFPHGPCFSLFFLLPNSLHLTNLNSIYFFWLFFFDV